MSGRIVAVAVCGLLAATSAQIVSAQSASAQVAFAQAGEPAGPYLFIDGAYQSVQLPRYGAGLRHITNPAFAAPANVIADVKPRLDGGSIAGGIGYRFADGLAPFLFVGTNGRVELSVAYAGASGGADSSGALDRVVLQSLDTVASITTACLPQCNLYRSALDSRFESLRVDLKAASDIRLGALTLSPSVAVFAGGSRIRQTLWQSWVVTVFSPDPFTYRLGSSIRSTDIGGRIGLDASVAVTPWLALGLNGTVALAARDTDLSADDRIVTPAFFGGVTYRSAATASGSPTAVISTLEASVTVRPTSNLSIRAFGGLSHDDKVPALIGPNFRGAFPGPTALIRPDIGFFAATSYHAGARATWRF